MVLTNMNTQVTFGSDIFGTSLTHVESVRPHPRVELDSDRPSPDRLGWSGGQPTHPAKPMTPPAKGKIPPVKERTTSAKGEVRKKKSPSTLRRNAERREEFLKKEPKVVKSAPVKSASDTESNT